MDSKKKLKKYVGAAGAVKVLSWIFAILCIASTLMCTVFRQTENTDDAVKFDSVYDENSDYVYLDVIGISDWLYKYTIDNTTTTYYAVEDSNLYLYIVEMDPEEANELTELREFWNREDSNAPQPLAYRMYGTVQPIDVEKRSDFADACRMTELEFDKYFGVKYLNVGDSPAASNNLMWTVFAAICGIFWLAFIIGSFQPNRQLKYSLKMLEENGELDRAAEELDKPIFVTLGLEKGRATEHYIFGRRTGVIVRYEDIVWCYPEVVARGKTGVDGCLCVNTKDRKRILAVNFGGYKYGEAISNAMAIIEEHNPNVLVGKSRENKMAYKEIYKSVR